MMFITHFNKLIRNKFLWTCFAVIVVLSFVMWGTQTGDSQSANQSNRIGKLDGKFVKPQEFQSAYFNSLLSMSLMFGRPLKVDERIDAVLRVLAWRRLVALRAAQGMQIPVTDDEVIGAIRQQPYFSVNGQFQQDRYNAFVNRFLASLQTSEPQFEEHIRQEILLNKVKYLLAQAAWISPQEVEQVFHQLYDTLVISYVFLGLDDLDDSVKISEDQAKSYFEGHREEFKIPEKMRVKWVAFPIEDFLDEGRFDVAVLRDYYEGHIEDFTVRGTNDLLTATPFEMVEDDLRQMLAWEDAEFQVVDWASEFEVALTPDRQGRAPSFEAAAGAMGLQVSTSAYFTIREPIPGLDGDLKFSKAAFELRRTPDDYFSRPLVGDNACYILAYDDRTDARIPEYQEVRDEVMVVAREQAVVNKLDQVIRRIYNAVSVTVDKGVLFKEALQGSGLEVVTTEPFSIKEGLENNDFEHFYVLVKSVLTRNALELTELIPVKNGYVFGFVASRVPASRIVMESVRNDLAKYIRKRREDNVFTDWQEYLLASAKFEDLSPRKKAARLDQEEDWDEEISEDQE